MLGGGNGEWYDVGGVFRESEPRNGDWDDDLRVTIGLDVMWPYVCVVVE